MSNDGSQRSASLAPTDLYGSDRNLIEQVSNSMRSAYQLRNERGAAAVCETAAALTSCLRTWRDNLCKDLEDQLSLLAIGFPPSFVRVAGQSHLEKPLNRLLAWLADPNGDHGCGSAFLRALGERIGFTEMLDDLKACSFTDVLVSAEDELHEDTSGKKPDLAVRLPKSALMLENKVSAPESGDQYTPYLSAFYNWAGTSRAKRSILAARSTRDLPAGWDHFMLHREIAETLRYLSRGSHDLPIWGKISFEICAQALDEDQSRRKIETAKKLLAEARSQGQATIAQIQALRDIIPLPAPTTPWHTNHS